MLDARNRSRCGPAKWWVAVICLAVALAITRWVIAGAPPFGLLIATRSEGHIAAMLIRTEQTPNPATRKFLPGQTVMDAGTRDFADAESAQASPLAARLVRQRDGRRRLLRSRFHLGHRRSRRFAGATSSRSCSRPCSTISSAARRCSRRARAAGIHVAGDTQIEENPDDADIIDQIKELIETRVRPAVAQDGGDIVYKGYRDGHLYLSMHGACSGCPSSTVTLKRGIESLIRHYVPEVEIGRSRLSFKGLRPRAACDHYPHQ